MTSKIDIRFCIACAIILTQLVISDQSLLAESGTKSQDQHSKKYDLYYQFKTGDFVYYQISDASSYTTQKDEIKETAKNQSLALRQYRVVSTEKSGETTLELMIEQVRLQAQFDDNPPVVFDSNDPEKQPAQFKHILKTVGKPMSRIRVNRKGELLKVQNFIGEQPKKVDQTLNFLVVFPDKKVSIGESWSQTLEIEVLVTKTLKEKVKLLRKYRLDSVKGDQATISLTTALITPVRDPAVQVRLMQQTPSGNILFDLNRHVILSRETSTDSQVIGAFGAGTLVSAMSKRLEKLAPKPIAKKQADPALKSR